jgi:transposase
VLSFWSTRNPDAESGVIEPYLHYALILQKICNRTKPKTQDGRPLRRYKRRWKIERLFAWLYNFRRLVVRYEYHAANFLGMVHLGCAVILLQQF